jgi:ABC-type nitrate/sulfonate/bicarbonate transport system substrate-binding protein
MDVVQHLVHAPEIPTGQAATQVAMARTFLQRSLSRRAVLLGASSALAGAALSSCSRGSTPGSSQSLRTVRVGMLRISPHLMAPRFYSRFLPPGLAIETLAFNNSTEIKTAVVTGSVDFAVTGVTAALQGASRGEPFVVLAAAADGPRPTSPPTTIE